MDSKIQDSSPAIKPRPGIELSEPDKEVNTGTRTIRKRSNESTTVSNSTQEGEQTTSDIKLADLGSNRSLFNKLSKIRGEQAFKRSLNEPHTSEPHQDVNRRDSSDAVVKPDPDRLAILEKNTSSQPMQDDSCKSLP